MKLDVLPDAAAVAAEAARAIAAEARRHARERGRFTLAVSGGSTPWKMLAALLDEDVPWEALHLFQVDERVAPPGDPDRNMTHLRESLLDRAPLPERQIYPMPVEDADTAHGAAVYARLIEEVAGSRFDLVHLGLGPDGHTASLVPGDPVCEVADRDVALTSAPYQGRLRMTLTFPALDRAEQILWVVTGASKAPMLRRLQQGDRSIPAGRVRPDAARILADHAAAHP